MYHAVKGINEDSYGYDYVNMTWKGAVKIRPGIYQMVELSGDDGLGALVEARKNDVLPEDGISTGDVAIGTPPALGTEPKRAKKAKKKGGQVIHGEKDRDGDEE